MEKVGVKLSTEPRIFQSHLSSQRYRFTRRAASPEGRPSIEYCEILWKHERWSFQPSLKAFMRRLDYTDPLFPAASSCTFPEKQKKKKKVYLFSFLPASTFYQTEIQFIRRLVFVHLRSMQNGKEFREKILLNGRNNFLGFTIFTSEWNFNVRTRNGA